MPQSCHSCGQTLMAGSRFCGGCGAPVAVTESVPPNSIRVSAPAAPSPEAPSALPVAAARTPSPPLQESPRNSSLLNDLMPSDLAAKIKSGATLIVGERREVTVLFVNVTGFINSHQRLDSEDVYLLTDEAMHLLIQIVYQFEGTVDKFTGDGLMALFGAPVTHENDPERAVLAALAMQSALIPLRERCLATYGLEFQFRIGVNTGMAIAGSLGSNLHMEYTVIGDTVNLASRLESVADPGSALVSFSTYQRTRALFDFQVLPPFHVKGKPDLIRAYQPLGLRSRPDRVRGVAGLDVPMVGRQEMLEELMQTWEMVQTQQKCEVALITGDAGLGKSRLVAEFRRLLDPGVLIHQGSCLAHTRSTPFWILGSLLRDILCLSEGDSAQVYQERIDQYLQELDLQSDELTPYILNVLGVEQPNPDLTARLSMMDAAILQQQTHVALHQALRAQARRKEIVLIWEDIHWIDSASRNFLVELLRSSSDLPIFFVLISREYERTTVVQPIIAVLEKQHAWNVDIRLQALSADQEYALIDQLLSQAGVRLSGIHRHIARRAEGNPFYIEEIIRMLLDTFPGQMNRLEEETPEDESAASGESASPEAATVATLMNSVPGSLTGLILARYDNLSEPLRSALQVAAVIGRSFPVSLLEELLAISADRVLDLLAELVERQFLVVEAVESEMGFSFRHALVQEAVYGRLLNRSRRQIHAAVAAALDKSRFLLPDERTEALAYHYSHTDEPQRAIPHLVAAAQNADRRSAYETSIQFYRRALALFDSAPTPFSHIYSQVHVGLGKGLKLSGEFEEARLLQLHGYEYLRSFPDQLDVEMPLMLESLRELADVCQRAGNFASADGYLKEALALASPIKESPLWYTLVERTAWVQFRLGELEESTRLARSAIRRLEEQPNQQPFTLASFYNTLGGIAWQQGNLSEAISYVEGSLKMYEPQGFVWGISVACSNLGILHWTVGQWAAGTEWYERAAKIQEENGFNFELATSLRNLGYLRMAQGDMEIAHHHFEQSLALCLQQSHSYGALATHLALGSWATEKGDEDELSQQLQLAQSYTESADTESLILFDLLTAQDLSNHRQYTRAVECCERALHVATEGQMQAELVEVYQILGAIYSKIDEFEKAEHHLMMARQLADERNAPDRVANAQLALALLYERMVHTDTEEAEKWKQDALALVRAAIAHYERLGARSKLHQAQGLEEKLFFHLRVDEPWEQDTHWLEPVNGIRIPISPEPVHQSENSTPDGEKARVTILWLAVEVKGVGDAEDVFSQMAEILGAVGQIVKESGGHIIRHARGMAATFGAPTACEDGPTQSIHCASKIAAHLAGMVAADAGSLSYRIGLDHGDAVVGFLDPHNRSLFVITGEPMSRSAQLAQAASDGSIWLSHTLFKLTENSFRFLAVKPMADAVGEFDQVMEFVSVLPVDQHQISRRSRTRLIGRTPILEKLAQKAAAIEQNGSGFVWLEGEAGIGKSRLLDEFCDRLNGADLYIWRGACSSQNTQQPFSLFSSLLQDIFDFGMADSPDEKRAKLQQYLTQWATNPTDVLPYLELLCGISPLPHDVQRLANLEPEALRQQIFVAVRTILVGMMQQRPLVLVLDDLHWLDPMSASLLVFLSQMVASMPMLFLFSHRPADSETMLNELSSIRTLHEDKSWSVNLKRLSKEESRLLLRELLPSGELSMEAYRFILERSDGNPYYMEEFLRLLIEQDYLQMDGTIWSPKTDTPLRDMPLPLTLEALIRSRVDSLPMQQRQLLQWAAVIGRSFSLDLLIKLARTDTVELHIQELSQRNLLVADLGEHVWHFNHHIAQIVVYNSMLRVRLKALHLQVADVLEAEWGSAVDEHAEELAYHFSLAEETDRALRYLVIAGERAEASYANDEALSYYRRARDILQESASVVANELRWRVIAGLGDTYRFVGKYDLSITALEEGLAMMQRNKLDIWRKAGIFRRLGQTCMSQGKPETAYDHFRQSLVALEEPEDRPGQIEAARTLYYLTYTHFRRGQWEKAKESCLLCLHYAEKANDLRELAAAENLLGGIAYQQGEREQAMQHTAIALELRERVGYTWGVASTTGNLAILAGESGEWDRAKRHFLRSLHLRQELGDMEGVAIVNNNLGWLGRIKGTLDEAEEHFRESLKIAETFKMIYHAANAMLGIGHIRQIKGDTEEAQLMIRGGVERAEQVDAQDLLSEIYRVQADILLDQGAADKAEESARLSVLLASETGSASLEADAWRVVSECLYRQGHLRRAEEAIHLARAAQTGTIDTIECGRVAIQMGRILGALDRIEEAQTEFQKSEEILSRIGAEYDLYRLAQERAALSDRVGMV